jgi:uncharacterized protein with FMN-binding domain
MKKLIKIFIIILVIIILILTIGYYKIKNMPLPEIKITNINLSNIKDGKYYGEYHVQLVSVKLNVYVKNHRIYNIEVLEHKNGLGKKGEKITKNIIAKQSLEVDSISGATLSSNVIKKAIYNALNK